MPADAPTILATSGGIQPGRRVQYEFSALTDYAVDLSGVTGRAPRVRMVPTAQGDNSAALRNLDDAACSIRTWSGFSGAASPDCWRCGTCTVSMPRCVQRGGQV